MTESNTTNAANPAPIENPHKPADDSEHVYFNGSPKLRGEIEKIIALGVVGIGLIWLAVYFRQDLPFWLMMTMILIGIIAPVIPWIITKTVRYRISNYRIDVERGLLSKSIDTLELWHVADIKLYQSVFDRIMGVGKILVFAQDATSPKLELRDLPDPKPLFEQMKQRIIAVKRQRGVIKVDGGGM